MLPFQPRRAGLGLQLVVLSVLAAILAGVAFACMKSPVLLFFIPIFIALGTVMNRWRRKQLRALAASRPGESLCSFARGFDYRDTDTWIIRAVYEELQGYLKSECADFPIRPGDRLEEDLKIDGDDLNFNLANQIAERTGRSLTDADKNSYYGKVKTVRDLVSFFVGQENSKTALAGRGG
jgi:hypothetical protein